MTPKAEPIPEGMAAAPVNGGAVGTAGMMVVGAPLGPVVTMGTPGVTTVTPPPGREVVKGGETPVPVVRVTVTVPVPMMERVRLPVGNGAVELAA